jgi:hypothetical protein
MKKLLIVLFSASLALGASAQRVGHLSGGGYVYRPHVVVGVGLGYGYGPFFPYYGWGGPWGFGYPYGYPPYYYGYGTPPPRLAYQINGIKSDYQAQIKDTRHDKSLTHKEKRERIKQLKHDRDQAVVQARRDYFNNSRRNNNNGNRNNNGSGNNGNGGNGSNNNGNGNSGNNGNGNGANSNGNNSNDSYNQ